MHHGDSAVFRVDPSRGSERGPDFWLSDRYGGQKGFAARGPQPRLWLGVK